MVKNTFYKSWSRSIKESIGRYLSIISITMLGSGVLTGLLAVSPDMKITGDSYYDKQNFMDLTLMSNVGFSTNDVYELEKLSIIESITPVYTVDRTAKIKEKNHTIRMESLHKKHSVNKLKLISGNMPKKDNEVVIVDGMMNNIQLNLGDTIYVNSSDLLHITDYKIVGTIEVPQYSSSAKISTSEGKGKIDAVLYAKETAFNQKYYTSLYVSLKGTSSLNTFSKDFQKKIADSRKQIEQFSNQQKWLNYNAIKDELIDSREALDEIETTLLTSEQALNKSHDELSLSKKELSQSKSFLTAEQIEQLTQNINSAEKIINENSLKLKEEKQKYREKEKELKSEEEFFSEITQPAWFVLNRHSNESYSSFKSDSESMEGMSKIFPILFYIVAVFVSLTTMTRMIDEDRILIGTLKALGFTNGKIKGKYLFYAISASLIGSCIGGIAGTIILPKTIWEAYRNFYYFPPLEIHFYPKYMFISIISLIIVISFITLLVLKSSLKEPPANLLLPKTPMAGKRILLERIPLFWKRLSFTYKVTVRNMFLDKKRMLMTTIGILGCTMLLITGFGLSNSVSKFTESQYKQILNYDLKISFDAHDNKPNSQINQVLSNRDYVHDSVEVYSEAFEIKKGTSSTQSHFLEMIVPKSTKKLINVITLQSMVKNKTSFTSESVIISEKIAEVLSLNIGDIIQVKPINGSNFHELTITDITKNYEANYLYVGKSAYTNHINANLDYNLFLIKKNPSVKNKIIEEQLSSITDITSITFNTDLIASTKTQLESINMIVIVLIIVAGILAFVVLYNITNINIEERKRELATLEVLGFYPKETYVYIFREITGLTMIGCLLGLFSGSVIYKQVLSSLETEFYKFNPSLTLSSFMYSIILTFLFSLLVNLLMIKKIKKINMLEALKSVE